MRGRTLVTATWGLVLGSVAFPATVDEARALYSQAEYARAAAILQQLPPQPPTLLLLGQCLYQEGEFNKASQVLEKAAAAEPGNSLTRMWLGRAYGRRAENAFPLAAPGLASKAREAFELAVRLDPSNLEAMSDLFEYYLDAPGFLGGGLDKARALIPKFAQYDKAEAQFAEARLDEKQKQFNTAEEHLRQAVMLAPRQIGRVIDLARFLARRGRHEESEQVFQQAAKIEPESPKLLYARAETWIETKRNLNEAKKYLNRYLEARLTPDDPTRTEARRLLKKAESN